MPATGSGDALANLPSLFQLSLPPEDCGIVRPRTADAASGDRQARPDADYGHSLRPLQSFRRRGPDVPTKSGLMLGLGGTDAEVFEVMRDLREHGVEMLTVGQCLQPRSGNLPVRRYVPPREFEAIAARALAGFAHAACGPLVRSSYRAGRLAIAASV